MQPTLKPYQPEMSINNTIKASNNKEKYDNILENCCGKKPSFSLAQMQARHQHQDFHPKAFINNCNLKRMNELVPQSQGELCILTVLFDEGGNTFIQVIEVYTAIDHKIHKSIYINYYSMLKNNTLYFTCIHVIPVNGGKSVPKEIEPLILAPKYASAPFVSVQAVSFNQILVQ